MNASIPNYNLQRAHDENQIFHGVPKLSCADGIRALRLKLYDEDRGRLVTFAQARERCRPRRRALDCFDKPCGMSARTDSTIIGVLEGGSLARVSTDLSPRRRGTRRHRRRTTV